MTTTTRTQTPEQVASDVYWTISDFPLDPNGDDLRGLMARAIQADRDSRSLEIYIVQNDSGDIVGVFRDADEATSFYQDSDYSVIEETVSEPGELADARIAELTAAWEQATGDTASDYALSEDDWAFGLGEDDAAEISRLIEWKEGR